jgi:hypothetical protein
MPLSSTSFLLSSRNNDFCYSELLLLCTSPSLLLRLRHSLSTMTIKPPDHLLNGGFLMSLASPCRMAGFDSDYPCVANLALPGSGNGSTSSLQTDADCVRDAVLDILHGQTERTTASSPCTRMAPSLQLRACRNSTGKVAGVGRRRC